MVGWGPLDWGGGEAVPEEFYAWLRARLGVDPRTSGHPVIAPHRPAPDRQYRAFQGHLPREAERYR